MKGRFLVLEGIDGCGKTTQLRQLAEWLPDSGLMPEGATLHLTREPGGTPLGRALRELLLHPPDEAAPCPEAELLMYAADRAQHVQRRILPALACGDWVLSDRFSGSTLAYQGDGRGLDRALILALERIATAGLVPDVTLWLDLSLEASMARREERAEDRIEAEGQAFLARVADGFRQLAAERGWVGIPAALSPKEVHQAIRLALEGHAALRRR
ncbi:MAG: dTMP kinase [Synechococcus sp.]|uniref:dTMP kinase n=1 Tax=Synechococcus sp. BMK-MC-1 TaxID=1442551 RepID=UPI001647EF32|nr:dTMP kinase [Synechococcus sp. BMK-MC-1]QNI68871.1 dTMP kinase [Synechococcus sp. BMK-MC-1]